MPAHVTADVTVTDPATIEEYRRPEARRLEAGRNVVMEAGAR